MGSILYLTEVPPDRDVHIDYRFAPAGAQVHERAQELIALHPDVILAHSTPVAAAPRRNAPWAGRVGENDQGNMQPASFDYFVGRGEQRGFNSPLPLRSR
jgi:hypothetical protein